MRASCLLGLALVAVFCPRSVEPLAREPSFNIRFKQCLQNRDLQRNGEQKRVLGQVIPTGMTLHSFISTVERFERKFLNPATPARQTALALLHWFSLPGFRIDKTWNQAEQTRYDRLLYDIVKPMYSDELRSIAQWELSEELQGDDLDDQCFLMRALSHTFEEACLQNSSATGRLPLGPNGGQDDPYGNNQQDSSQQQQSRFQSNLNNQRQRGSPLGGSNPNRNSNSNYNYNNNNNNYNGNGNNNNNFNSLMPNRQAAVPNLRNSQAQLLSFTRQSNQNCPLREDGVVSITGLREDAIALGPVLMGIAASRLQYSGRDQWNQNDGFNDQAGLNYEKNPILLSTLGQQIGMAAFLRLLDDNNQNSEYETMNNIRHDFDIRGNWEYPGCLLAHILDTKRSVAYSRAAMSGAIDGAILGTMLAKQDFDGLTLAEVLRLYYSNNYVRVESQTVSVCNRASLYSALSSEAVLRQAELVAYNLSSNQFSDRQLSGVGSQLRSYVSGVIQSIEADLPSEYKTELCGKNNNYEQCSGQAELHVILDPSSSNVEVRRRQANILGRIVNGMDFRERRNTVHVYSGYTGGGLRKYPEIITEKQNITSGFTASGCPACLAHHLEQTYDVRSERELFINLDKTLNQTKSISSPLSKELALPGRVVLWFRMSGQPVEDAKGAAEALIRMRISHPEVRIIAIGDEQSLRQLNENSGALQFYDDSALDQELRQSRRDEDSKFDRIKRTICETPISIQNVECNTNNFNSNYNSNNNNNNRNYNDNNNNNNNNKNNNNNNYNNNNNNYNNNNNNRYRNGGTNREFSSGVDARRVQFVSYESRLFSGSSRFTVQFASVGNGNIKVCDLSSDYEYVAPGQGISNVNNNNNNNNDNYNDPYRFCFQTTNSMRSITYNYTRRCYDGPRSCAALRYAVVGLDPTSRISANCRAPFCESPMSASYSVRPEGMICASSSTLASVLVIVVGLIAAFRLA